MKIKIPPQKQWLIHKDRMWWSGKLSKLKRGPRSNRQKKDWRVLTSSANKDGKSLYQCAFEH